MEKGESPSLIFSKEVIRFKSENQVPIVASPREPRIPHDPSKASGDRLQNPSATASGDRSREVLLSEVPKPEKLRAGVPAPGERSKKVPERLQPFTDGLHGEPPDLNDVVVEHPVVEPKEREST